MSIIYYDYDYYGDYGGEENGGDGKGKEVKEGERRESHTNLAVLV